LGKLAQNPGKDGLTPAQKATLHELVQQAHDMLTGGKIDETAEHLKFDVDGSTGALDHAGLSLSADAPANALSASATVSMDGLALDSLPPELASYVPTRFSIHPTVSNIDLAVLTKMALDATAPGPNPPAPDGSALFAKGGIRYGFDGLALDVAGVSVTGTGQFTSPTAKSFIGQAELSARGLDTLIARAQTDPNVAPAVPVIIFLKGIAKTAGDRSVWQITVDNAKILVNGVDLSSLAGTVTK
jgi:hypothetical protein